MTEDKKAIRLSKAAREFNVGIQTIVEFLNKNGFDISHDPNCKIPPEAYALIVKEYSGDLSVKKDAEKLALKEKITPKKSLSIEDMETGREVKMNPIEFKEQYNKSMAERFNKIKLKCMQYHIDFVPADINQGHEQVMLSFLVKRSRLY